MIYTGCTVQFRKQLSDGNYGSETVEVTLTAAISAEEDTDDPGESIANALREARLLVLSDLACSDASPVRVAAEKALARLMVESN